MEKPLQPCKTDYVRSSALPAAEVTTIVRCLNAKTLLVRQLPLVFMPACQWRLTNSRVSVRRGERQLFAARHATIDSGGRVTLANYSQHIFKCAWKAGWPAATGVDTPQTAGYHRGIPEAEVTPPPPPPPHPPSPPRFPLLRCNQSCGWQHFKHPAVLMLHTDSCSRTVTGSARLLITELTHRAAMYFGIAARYAARSAASTELHNARTG